MKLKELKSILYSQIGSIQTAIVYDLERNIDLTEAGSIESAIVRFGEREVKRITAYNDTLIITV